ncbi:hypothetical protein RF11_01149 [Thelohanellus kitauei]|uniref:Uncharacterized protein n=1 Tax=Thelohanellus kitauei TaxID=669202 RepID=A0A0C2IGB0_THEKT|nr:hypothetical protein RF11_01149 [Thelohanellus kitauei]
MNQHVSCEIREIMTTNDTKFCQVTTKNLIRYLNQTKLILIHSSTIKKGGRVVRCQVADGYEQATAYNSRVTITVEITGWTDKKREWLECEMRALLAKLKTM